MRGNGSRIYLDHIKYGAKMKCLRCGYCCLNSSVIILVDPDKPIDEDNMMHIDGAKRCPHLRGDVPGDYSCAIHEHPKYEETPCHSHGQIESSPDNECRLGRYILERKNDSL